LFRILKGLRGATAFQKKESTSWKDRELLGDKTTQTTTTIESKMVPSTERALSGVRPILINELNLRQPEKLVAIDLDNLIKTIKTDEAMMRTQMKRFNVEKKWLDSLNSWGNLLSSKY
jgi:hypothetical protein